MAYGIDQAFATAKAPWAGIGTELEGAATAEEAIVSAGLDWKVVKKNLYIKRDAIGYKGVEGKQALVRADTGDVLGVFSPRYSPLQNINAFNGISEVMQDHGAVFHSAGSLNEGRRIFIYGELPGTLVVNGDELARGLLLTNSHDGSAAVSMQLMAVRKVCFNTMNSRFRSGGFRQVHTGNLDSKMQQAREFLGIGNRYFEQIRHGVDYMSSTALTETMKEFFLRDLFGVELEAADISTRIRNQMDVVGDLFYQGIGNHGTTKWDMYNALTEYVDHHRGPQGEELVKVDRRLNSAWFGSGAEMKEKAWELLTA